MSKKEKIFPLNTIGGRIQKKRHDLKLSRRDLYNMVYQDRTDETVSDSSKEKTVYNWESETTELSYATLCSLCKTLNCSSDYLLGLDECSSKNAQFVYNATGLSEASQKILHEIIQAPYLGKLRLEIINHLIEDPTFSLALIDSINKCYEKYTRFKQGSIMYMEEKKEIDKLTQNNILEELRLKEAGKLPCKITREQLLERQDSYDASLMNVQRRFNDIIIDLIKEYYEKHYSNNL